MGARRCWRRWTRAGSCNLFVVSVSVLSVPSDDGVTTFFRAFGLIPCARRGCYDSETMTIERGYPFHLLSNYRTDALELARTCSS